jgi:ribosome-associated toxin RatA of RatAB toxin-antitoxin module
MDKAVHTEHSVSVLADAATVYQMLADVSRWPLCFTPTIHAERASGTDEHEQINIWALANGQPRAWSSRRDLDRLGGRITFVSETPQPPVRSMQGTWLVAEVGTGKTEVRLLHDFLLTTDDAAHREWVNRAVETNSTAELGALRAAAESPDELLVDFTDTIAIQGTPGAAYNFIYRCSEWPSRLPHVTRLALTEDSPGIQVMEMDTISAGGPPTSVHTTESVRICFPDTRIVYKQTRVPRGMAGHTGEWGFTPCPGGVEVSSRHQVIIDPVAAGELLPGAPASEVARQVQKTLSENSLSTLRCAKEHIEFPRAKAHGVGQLR